MDENIIHHDYNVDINSRRKLSGHNSFLVFFTGLSGSGKSTLANALEDELHKKGIHTYVLDGDNVRKGINKNLGFSTEDRSENNRRIGEICKLFIDAGVLVIAAFVAPYKKDREFIKRTVKSDNFIEVYVNTSLEVCEKRDVKGLYKKARAGEIKNMTGISDPYEVPENSNIQINGNSSIEESVHLIYNYIKTKIKLS